MKFSAIGFDNAGFKEKENLIYHGSNKIVKKPLYGFGKKENDYGQGFYTTSVKEKAEDWALLKNGEHWCNVYSLPNDFDGLKVFNLDECGLAAWVSEVLFNRGPGNNFNDNEFDAEFCDKYRVNMKDYDIIIGYRADDSYFAIIEHFLLGTITIFDVVKFFEKGELGKQIFLQSRKAFDAVRYVDAYRVDNSGADRVKEADRNVRRNVIDRLNRNLNAINAGRAKKPAKFSFSDMLNTNYIYNKEEKTYERGI